MTHSSALIPRAQLLCYSFATVRGHQYLDVAHVFAAWLEVCRPTYIDFGPDKYLRALDGVVESGNSRPRLSFTFVSPNLRAAVSMALVDEVVTQENVIRREIEAILLNGLMPGKIHGAVLEHMGERLPEVLTKLAAGLGDAYIQHVPLYQMRFGLS